MDPIEKTSPSKAESPSRVPFPLTILREAIRSVPEVKWALGVTGVTAAIAIIKLLGVSLIVATIGTVVMLILMMTLVIFASAARRTETHGAAVSKTFVWYVMLIVIAVTLLIFGSAIFNQPWPLRDLINASITAPPGASNSTHNSQRTSYKHTFEFAEPPLRFNVSRDDSKEPRERYRYGYTKLVFDKEQSGRLLTVRRMKVTLHITNKKDWLCCDVWVFLGDSPFRANPLGFSGVTLDPHRIGEMMGPIPVKLKLVLAQSDQQVFPPGPTDLYAEYEFPKPGFPKPVAQGNLRTSVKDASSTQFSLEKGVCAQVFVLTDFLVPNRPTDFDVNRLELEVEGFTDPSL